MNRGAALIPFIIICWNTAFLRAQTPAASPSPAPANVSPSPAATPKPTPAPVATSEIINKMAPADLQQVIQLLRSNYIEPAALNETELDRAMLTGVLVRLGNGVMLLPDRAAANETQERFYAEALEGPVGYLRLGTLAPAHLAALDAELKKFLEKKIDAVVLDLRASGASSDFALAAEFAKRFVPKGKEIFALRRAGGKNDRVFTNDREPAYKGLILVLADRDTNGPAEALAGALREQARALVLGQTTAGRAVEYAELPLNGGRVLRAAVAETVLPQNRDLFPGGLKPDVPVEMAEVEKREIFRQSPETGMAPYVFEKERPHLNEAALIAGRNPELDALEASQRGRKEKAPPRDLVLQRAVDLVTSLKAIRQ